MTDLEAAEESHAFILGKAREDLKRLGPNSDSYRTLTVCYRRLAIAALLRRSDTAAFRDNLRSSGRTLADLLVQIAKKRIKKAKLDPKHYCASREEPFEDALVGGDLETARAIVAHMPAKHFKGVEHERDFLRATVLARLFAEPEDRKAIDQRLERWKPLTSEGGATYFAVAMTIHAGNAKAFAAAFEDLVDARDEVMTAYRKTPGHNPDLAATEGKLWVGGLAVLRIAELRGLPTKRSYKFLPANARLPL